MKSRKRVLACSGSIFLPRLCHQRTRISCQRSIAARSSCRLGDVAQLEPSVVEAAHVPAQVLAALAGQRLQVVLERAGQLDAGIGRRRPRAHAQPGPRAAPPRSPSPSGSAAQQQRVPFLGVRPDHAGHGVVDRLARARLRQHRPVVAGGPAQLGQDPERPAPSGDERGDAREPAPVAHRHDPRPRAPAQCGHHACAQPADENGVASGSRAEQLLPIGQEGLDRVAMKLGVHLRVAPPPQLQHSQARGRSPAATLAQQQSGQRVIRGPCCAGARAR